ncbi:MAG: class I SAM-dependent methyltransferase [Acidimicrobiales bacterium]
MSEDPFDQMAETWDDDPAKVERARVVAERIVAELPLGPGTRVLEYGAGTGLVSQALQGHVGSLTLVDTSAGMRAAIEAKVAAGTLPADTRTWSLDLATDEPPDERFDLIVTVQVLHHVHDLAPVLAAFAQLLEPGGRLCIVDLDAEDGSFHGEGFGGHHGFHRDHLAAQLTAAGFSDVAFDHAYDLQRDGRTYPLFIATATR